MRDSSGKGPACRNGCKCGVGAGTPCLPTLLLAEKEFNGSEVIWSWVSTCGNFMAVIAVMRAWNQDFVTVIRIAARREE